MYTSMQYVVSLIQCYIRRAFPMDTFMVLLLEKTTKRYEVDVDKKLVGIYKSFKTVCFLKNITI